MANNYGYNPRAQTRNQNPRFANRPLGPPNFFQALTENLHNFVSNSLSSMPRNTPPGYRNQFGQNPGNQFGQNRSVNSGFQSGQSTRPSDFHPRFISKPNDEHRKNPYHLHKKELDEVKHDQSYKKELHNDQTKSKPTRSNQDNQRNSEFDKGKLSEKKDESLKFSKENNLNVDGDSVDKNTCDITDIDMDIDENEDEDTNIDVYDVSMSQKEEDEERDVDQQEEKKADLPKDVSESPRQDLTKDLKIQEKTDTTESPKTLEKKENKNINIQEKDNAESAKKEVVAATEEDEDEEEDSDSEDTGYCSYCKMEFSNADAYWKHTRGLLHTQKLMEANKTKSDFPSTADESSQPEEPATSSYVPRRGELVTAAAIKASNNETHLDLYNSFQGNQKWESSKTNIESQYKSVSENQKSELYKSVPGSKKFESGKPTIESQYHGDGFQSKSDSYSNYKGYNYDDYEDLEEEGTMQENWMDVETTEIKKVPVQERDLAPEDVGKNQFPDEFYCKLCDTKCTGPVTYRMHLDGRAHKSKVEIVNSMDTSKSEKLKLNMPGSRKTITIDKEPKINKLLAECSYPMIGLQYVTEFHRDDQKTVRYVCNLCEAKCDGASIISHVIGSRHRLKYLKEHHSPVYSHLMQFSSTKKKSDINMSAEMFARDIQSKEGRRSVKVRLEIGPSTEKAAIQLIKSAAVQIPELLSYTGKSDVENDQRDNEGYTDYKNVYSYHSSSKLNEKRVKSGPQTKFGNDGYYDETNAYEYEDTESYYDSEYGYNESYDYGHGHRGGKRSLESKSYTGASRLKSKSYSGHEYGEEDSSGYGYDDSYGYGYDENYGYGAGDHSRYRDNASYNENESYYEQQDDYHEDYTAPYSKKHSYGVTKGYEDEPPSKMPRKNYPSSTFEQWEEEEEGGNSQESAGYSQNFTDKDRLKGFTNNQNIPEPEKISGSRNSKTFPDPDQEPGSRNSPNPLDKDKLVRSRDSPNVSDKDRLDGSSIKQGRVPGAGGQKDEQSSRLVELCEMFNDKDKELFLQFLQFKTLVEERGGDMGSFSRSMMQKDQSSRYGEQDSKTPTPYPSDKEGKDPCTGSPVVQKFDYGHKSSLKLTQEEILPDVPQAPGSSPAAPSTTKLESQNNAPPADSTSSGDGKEGDGDQPKITDMLSSLANSLICTEEEAEMALQVSNALTQALLQYRLKKLPQNLKANLPEETKQKEQSPITLQQQLKETQTGDIKTAAQQPSKISLNKPAEPSLSPTTTKSSDGLPLQDPTLPVIQKSSKPEKPVSSEKRPQQPVSSEKRPEQPVSSEKRPDIEHLLNTINPKELQKVINAEKNCPPDQVVSATPDIKQLLSSINPAELQKALNMAQNQTGGQIPQPSPSLKSCDIQKILNSVSPADLQKVAAAVQSQPSQVPLQVNVSMSNPLLYRQSAEIRENVNTLSCPPVPAPSSMGTPTSQHMVPQQPPQMMTSQQPNSSMGTPTSQHMMPQQHPQMMTSQQPNSSMGTPTSQHMMPQQRPQMMTSQQPNSSMGTPTSQRMMPQQPSHMMTSQQPNSSMGTPTSQHMMPQQRPQMMTSQQPNSSVGTPTSQRMMPQQPPQMRTSQQPNGMPRQTMTMCGMQPRMYGWNEQMHRMPQQRGMPMGVNPPLPQGPRPPPPPGPPPRVVQPPPPPSSQKY